MAGSGFAAVEAVRTLAAVGACGPGSGNECILAAPRPVLSFVPYAPAVAGGRLEPGDVEIDIRGLLERSGFSYVEARLERVEEGRAVLSGGREEEYDYLLIAAGARPAFYGVKGADTEALPLYSVADAARLREEAAKAETVAIVGAGFVGVEAAAELLEAAEREGRRQRVVLIDLLPEPLGLLRNKAASMLVYRILSGMGAEFVLGEPVVEVSRGGVTLKSGRRVEADLVVWSAGFQGPAVELPEGSVGRGRFILVDRFLRVKGLRGVYAAGDAAAITREDGCMALKMAREALRSGAAAALNIAAELRGEKPRPYRPAMTTCVPQAGIMLGEKHGVMVLGRGVAFESRIPHHYHDHVLEELRRLAA